MEKEELINWLRATGREHHVYQTETLHGKQNKDWATWYAAYLKEHTNIFGKLEVVDIATLLTIADELHRKSFPQMKWWDYYANFIDRHIVIAMIRKTDPTYAMCPITHRPVKKEVEYA